MSTTPTDREMLEWAAKAAGVAVHWGNLPHQADMLFLDDSGQFAPEWNPRDNNGDALQLAVKLRLHIGLESHAVSVWSPRLRGVWCTEPCAISDDTAACNATRRAITRAASEIGHQQAKEKS